MGCAITKVALRKLSIVLLWGFVSVICFETIQAKQAKPIPSWGKVSDSEWAQVPPADIPNANAVILFSYGRTEVTFEGITQYRHVRIKVFTAAGAEEAGNQTIWYFDEDIISDLSAQTLLPDGQKFPVQRSAFKEKKVGERIGKVFAFEHIEPGAILEFKYQNYNTRFGILEPWYFNSELYTVTSRYEIALAGGFNYSTAWNNVPATAQQPEDVSMKEGKFRTFAWTLNSLLPLRDEPYAGQVHNYASALYCQLVSFNTGYGIIDFIKGWPDLGELMTDGVIEPYIKKGKEVKQLVKELVLDSLSSYTKTQSIFHFVRDSIRSSSPKGGLTFDNKTAEKLLATRTGTGTEKNLAIIALCRQAGLTAWPLGISSRSRGVFIPSVYHINQLDHFLAAVETDSGTVLLDASSKYLAFASLPSDFLIEAGLLLNGKESKIVSIAAPPLQTDYVDKHTIIVTDSGAVICTTQVVLTGYFAHYYGNKYSETDPESFFKDVLLSRLDFPFELQSYDLIDETKDQRLVANCVFTSDKIVETIDDIRFVTPIQLAFRTNPFESEQRFFPIDFDFPRSYYSITRVLLGDHLSVSEMPKDINEAIDEIQFSRMSKSDDTAVTVIRSIRVDNPIIQVNGYASLRSLFKEIELTNRDRIALVTAKRD